MLEHHSREIQPNSVLAPKAEDIKNPALSEVKAIKDEDVKDIKYVKTEDSKDLKREESKDFKPVDMTRDGGRDGDVVYLGVNRRNPPLLDHHEIGANPAGEGITSHGQEDIEMMITDPAASSEDIDAAVLDEQSAQNDHAEALGLPRKKPRLVLDAIVLPTMASILKKRVLEQVLKEEINEKIKMLSNPIVKKKKNMEMSVDTVRERLKAIGYDLYPVPLDKATQDVTVTRQFMSDVYGGNSMETNPRIRKDKLALHGIKDFLFLNLDLNPQAPQLPGAPGLLFAIDSSPGEPPGLKEDKRIFKMFARLQSAVWQHCGDYKTNQALSLTKEEWAEQLTKVRNTWATQLCIKGWGHRSRARIHLRQTLKREPTKAELEAALDSGESFKHTVPAQFSEALLRGQERMGVYTLKCISYDTTFQRNLANKFPTWVPPPPKPKGGKKLATKKGKGDKKENLAKAEKPAPKMTGNKRKQMDLQSSDSEGSISDEEPDYSAGEEERIEPIYVPRGARSRPIPVE